MSFSAPRPIDPRDRVSEFSSSEPELDNWLAKRALGNESSHASRTFVSLDNDTQSIAGFVSIAAGSVAAAAVSGRVRRNQPNPIPTIVIGRLAVDSRFARRGVGSGLLHFALVKCLEAGLAIGARAIIVEPISPDARAFYRRFGFDDFPGETGTMMYLLMTDLVQSITSD